METRQKLLLRACAAVMLAFACGIASAIDIAIMDRRESESDYRRDYYRILLNTVMERTKAEYGPYSVEEAPMFMERPRLMREMQAGKKVNIVAIQADPDWLQALPSIPIPVELGLHSWRLAFIDGKKQAYIRRLVSKGQLKSATAGVGTTWVLKSVLESNGYATVKGNSYGGLFLMLQAGRFDYYLRGIPDVLDEFHSHHHAFPDLKIDDSMVVYARVPILFFVAPGEERLRQRVTAGMEAMMKDGTLEQLVLKYFRADLERANLCSRTRIDIPNPDLDPAMQARRELWLDPYEARHRLCKKIQQAGRSTSVVAQR